MGWRTKRGTARFQRVPSAFVGGEKLCGRRAVNPTLSPREAVDVEAFRRLLVHAFGAVEPAEEGFAVGVHDRETHRTFEAYSGASGPAYGGRDAFDRLDSGGLVLKQEVRALLEAFEQWLCARPSGPSPTGDR